MSGVRILFSEDSNPNTSKWNILFDKAEQWICFIPTEGVQVYPCYSCQDMYGSKTSFLDHINRRGLIIAYNCRACLKRLTFYNPCSFLLHCRKHFDTDPEPKINLENVNISAIPFGMAGFPPHPTIPMIYDVKEDMLGRVLDINTQFYIPLPECKGQSIVHFKSSLTFFHYTKVGGEQVSLMLKQTSINIPHCEFVVNKNFDLNERGKSAVEETEMVVAVKEEVFGQNACIAEEQISDTVVGNIVYENLCCPECQLVPSSSLHYHFTKGNRPSNEKLNCKICKYVASSHCSLSAHERIHFEKPPYVCPECGKEYQDSSSLILHADEVCCHLAKQVRFKCIARNCGKIFAQADTYAAHFSVHMICMNSCKICSTICTSKQEYMEHMTTHELKASPQKIFKCSICNSGETFTDYKSHVNEHIVDRSGCVYVYICKHCRGYFRSKSTYCAHVLRCNKRHHVATDKQKIKTLKLVNVSCLKCQHVVKLPYGNASITRCPKCKEIYGGHGIKSGAGTMYTKVALTNVAGCIECVLCNNIFRIQELKIHLSEKRCKYIDPVVSIPKLPSAFKYKVVKLELKEKKKRKKNHTVLVKPKKQSISIHETTENQADDPIPFTGTYICNLCQFSTADRESFHTHVKTHRDNYTSFQCMECGECFVVKPSLSKHLLHFHQISDIDTYLEQNDCFDIQEINDSSEQVATLEDEEMQENQCRVCRAQFEDSLELKKHFRVHGMAFLTNNSK